MSTAQRTTLVTVLFGSLLVCAPGFAQEISERFVTGPSARLDVSNVSGKMVIRGAPRNEILLTGTLASNAELRLDHSERRVQIKVVKKAGARRMGSSDLYLDVPQDSELSIYAVSSDLEIEGVAGEQRLEVVSGDVRVSGLASDLEVKSVSGDIEVAGSGVPASARVVSVSGDTRVRDVAGDVEAVSVSGDTRVSGGEFHRVRLKSTSGGVEFLGALNPRGRLEAEVISGRVAIDLLDDAGLDVEIETFSGSIKNCFGEQAVRKSKYGPGRLLRFSRGAADRDVRVRSMSGSVRLCGEK